MAHIPSCLFFFSTRRRRQSSCAWKLRIRLQRLLHQCPSSSRHPLTGLRSKPDRIIRILSAAHHENLPDFPFAMKLLVTSLPFLSMVMALPSGEVPAIQAIQARQATDGSPAPIKNCQPGLKYCFNQIISDLGKVSPKAPSRARDAMRRVPGLLPACS